MQIALAKQSHILDEIDSQKSEEMSNHFEDCKSEDDVSDSSDDNSEDEEKEDRLMMEALRKMIRKGV